jgi:hypothetical protein
LLRLKLPAHHLPKDCIDLEAQKASRREQGFASIIVIGLSRLPIWGFGNLPRVFMSFAAKTDGMMVVGGYRPRGSSQQLLLTGRIQRILRQPIGSNLDQDQILKELGAFVAQGQV